MTTGTWGSIVNSASQYKYWSGSDGKYELDSLGRRRSKWNPYSMGAVTRFNVKPSTTGNYIHPAGTGYKWDVNDDVKLQEKLVDAVRNHDFDLGVTVAQGKLTVDLVRSNLGKLGKAILYLKRGDFANAARQLGAGPKTSRLKPSDVSGRWLELQYGWMPLIQDCHSAAEALAEIANGPRTDTIKVSRTVRDSVLLQELPGPPWGDDAPFECTRKTRCSIIYERTEALSAQRTLGLMDPLSVAWEIIPYSFVVDWFIPIGTYLDNLSIIPFLSGRFLRTITFMNVERAGPGIAHPSYIGAEATHKWVNMEREVLSSLTVARPSFKPFPSAMSPRHIWNAIALANQRFSSKNRIDYD